MLFVIKFCVWICFVVYVKFLYLYPHRLFEPPPLESFKGRHDRLWILDLREAKCGVEIYGEIKAKFLGAMWASHPTQIGVRF